MTAQQAAMPQQDVIAFLGDPASHHPAPGQVERIETHGAVVFLAGPSVYKIKRAVHYAYMDYSTLEKRHAMCLRELEINRRTAPGIYLDVVAITRETDDALAIGGPGTPVEWALHMRRFDQDALLAAVADAGLLDRDLVKALAATVAGFHRAAEPVARAGGAGPMDDIITELSDAFGEAPDGLERTAFEAPARKQLALSRVCLDARARNGHVRRCHGDLHLNNIVLIEGAPVLFDAIEFDDTFATIDTLYDLAFLVMDMDERGLRDEANLLLNRYLHHSAADADLEGLIALPLFLACRAGIRAMVTMQRARLAGAPASSGLIAEAQRYFDAATGYLDPEPARLIAVGGLSGTGKSTLAATLAPKFGAAPGAVHLRSDLMRKSLFGAEETERLGQEAYSAEATARVYEHLLDKARIALGAGRTVVVDAVFSKPHERGAAEAVAAGLGIPFHGLWLHAPRDALMARVGARTGDASDATADVVAAQLDYDTGEIEWSRVNAGGTAEQTLHATADIFVS
ncbi:MAG: AAA family ATPase [Hyphomicrobiales bacterium]